MKTEGVNKILSLESLRGVAAFTVVIDHFFRTFYPGTFVSGQVQHSQYEWFVSNTPLFMFVNGSFAVMIFFVLSGFVLSYGYFLKKFDLISAVVKRYFRLTPIVFASIMLAFILLRLGLFFNSQAGLMPFSWKVPDVSLLSALWDGLIGSYILQPNDTSLNSPLWTIYYELIGSVLVYAILSLLSGDSRRKWIYPFLVVIFLGTYYVGFVIGLILADIYCHKNEIYQKIANLSAFYKISMLLFAIWLASFPPLRTKLDISTIHAPLLFLDNFGLNQNIVLALGAIIIIVLLLTSKRLKKLFELRPLVYLGSISYSLYATHIIVMGSIACFTFWKLHDKLPYNLTAAVVFIVYVISSLLVAAVFRKYVDKPSIALSRLAGQYAQTKKNPSIATGKE